MNTFSSSTHFLEHMFAHVVDAQCIILNCILVVQWSNRNEHMILQDICQSSKLVKLVIKLVITN